MFLVLVNGAGQIMAGVPGQQGPVDFRQLKDMVQEFVLNPMDDETYPEKKDKEIELADGSKWVYPVSEGVVSLQTTRDTGYQVYIMVQNELTRAFNEIRDDVAMKKFNKKFADLNDDESKAVTTAVPSRFRRPNLVKWEERSNGSNEKKGNKGLPLSLPRRFPTSSS